MTEHPKFTAAVAALDAGDPRPIMRLAFGSREDASKGLYCDCSAPLVEGLDLMCRACLMHNKDQERAKVRSFAHAHEFVPGKMGGAFCKTCVRLADDQVHHGVNRRGVTSWGEPV